MSHVSSERIAELQDEASTIRDLLLSLRLDTPVEEVVRLQTRRDAIKFLLEEVAQREEGEAVAAMRREREASSIAGGMRAAKGNERARLRLRRAELEARIDRIDTHGAGTPPSLHALMKRLNTDASGATMYHREEVKRGIRHEISQVDDELRALDE